MKRNFLWILSVFSDDLFCGLVANSAPIPFVLLQSFLGSFSLESLAEGSGSPWPTAEQQSQRQIAAWNVWESSSEVLGSRWNGSRCCESHLKTCTVYKMYKKCCVLCLRCGYYAQVLGGRNILQTCDKTLTPVNSPSLAVTLDNKAKQNACLSFTNMQALPW